MRINIRKAERRYEDEMRRIRDEGLIDGERTQAIEAADAALARVKARLGWGARARMISLRQQFESNRLAGPYFPLSRFGEFFATVRDENGVVTNFSRFESVKDRDRMAEIERRKPGQKVEVGVVADANLRDMVDPTFVAEVEAILGEGFFRGGAKMSNGEYQRGAEMMLPKAVRDMLKTYRYATEGVVTTKGDPLIDRLPSYGLIVQALGFTPAEIAERFDVNSRLYERQEQILDQRGKVLAEAAKIVGAGKPMTDEVLEQINTFNAENPDYPITGDSIVRSVRARQKAHDRAEFGATLNPRLNDRLRAERAPMVFGG